MSDHFADNDTSPIREGEELNNAALEAYLRDHLPPRLQGEFCDLNAPLRVQQFPGGHSNLTYLVSLFGREFVLRRPPFGPVAPTAHDMPREYRLLAAIHPAFGFAPKPYLLCEDVSVIGVPFYLMERRRGLVIRRQLPEALNQPQTLRAISTAMIETLAALHAVDIYATGLTNLGKPIGFVTRQVKGWTERWHRAKTKEIPEIDAVAQWLLDKLPPEPDPAAGRPATLVHNDFKLDNVMLNPQQPAEVVAVLDWEMCTVGDPLVDLGILLCYWAEKDDPEDRREAISPVTVQSGWMTRQEITACYAERTGRDVSRIDFYEIFAIFKIAVVVQQIYFRYVRGQTHDERFAAFGPRIEGLARAALELARQSKL
ncbi:MAG: phosphotransferase family protein [Acidobacteria bacterium]|nr:phosphotransferase family protein [Acidobacteriota bacterium]